MILKRTVHKLHCAVQNKKCDIVIRVRAVLTKQTNKQNKTKQKRTKERKEERK